jgi:uncharacterized membrane protein YphA (DoxX/SURF4 family)
MAREWRVHLGRHVYGLGALIFSVAALVWHDFKGWQQFRALGNAPHREVLIYIAFSIELLGGIAIQWPRTARAGALALGGIYLAFALLYVPFIIATPLIYNSWGNFFEQFSLFSGALIVYASFARSNSERAAGLARAGYIFFGICVVSFTLEQLFYLAATAGLVPRWIPPGQMFWAITTTIAFALAAIALLSGRSALLASRLLAAMLIGFGLLVWLPALFADPHELTNWTEGSETLAIAGASWIVAELLGRNRASANATA